MDRIAYVETFKRNLYVVRDQSSIADELKLMPDDVQHRAALHAGRKLFFGEMHRHFNMHFAMFADAQKICVERAI